MEMFLFILGDYVSSNNEIFTNIDKISPTDIYNIQGFISGPIPGIENFAKIFLSGRYNYNDGAIYGQRIFNPSDSSNFSANNSEDWYVGSTGDNAYVPMNSNERLSLQGKVSIRYWRR